MENERQNAFLAIFSTIKYYLRDDANRRQKEKLIILSVAFIVRLILALIFWGSIDVTVSITNSLTLFKGEYITNIPYFPVIPAFIWIGGLLNTIPFMPIAFSYKIVPILFDILMSILIYDFMNKRESNSAFKIGLLYALSPVSIIITCIHGQWDSIFLFFLIFSFYVRECYKDTKIKYFVFGALFAVSMMIKPVSLMFAIFFFMPISKFKAHGFKKYFIYQINSIAGFISVVIMFFTIFAVKGYDLINLVKSVLFYSNEGIVIFGLPLFSPFDSIEFLKQRFWIMSLIVVISVFYYCGRIKVFDALLVSFALVISFAGLSPQYLVWMVPFLLINRNLKSSAVYTVVSTVFLMLYYMGPKASHFPMENMSTLATIKAFKWLMPPSFLSDDKFLPMIHIIGNCIIPMCSLFIALFVLIISIKSKSEPENIDSTFSFIKDKYLISISVLTFFIVFLYFTFKRLPLYDMLFRNLNSKFALYNITLKDSNLVGNYPTNSYINILYIMILGAVLWGIFAFKSAFKKEELRGINKL